MMMIKKRIYILVCFVALIILAAKIIKWYEPYYDANNFWGIKVPLKAKVLTYEEEYDFQGDGYTILIFDVQEVLPEMENIIKNKKFIKSTKDEIKYIRYKEDGSISSIKTYNNENMKADLGLNGGYYLDLASTSRSLTKLVVFNPKTNRLYFFWKKY